MSQLPAPSVASPQSEKMIVQAPMSFTGSARRIWRITRGNLHPAARVGLQAVAVVLVAAAWLVVLCWYVLFSVFLIPYRLIRRGARKRRRDELRHREMLAAARRRD